MISKHIILISVGMPGQSEAFEEPGINSIAAFLRAKGYDVSVRLALHEQIDLDEIERLSPILVGFSVYTDTYASITRLSKKIKERLPNTYIVLGGYVASYYPENVLRDIPWADGITVGEGEIPTAELADYLCGRITIEHVHSLVYRSEEGIVCNPKAPLIKNMDDVPFAARDIALQHDPTEIWVSTARGCTRNCAFCCSQDFWKNRETHNWRGRSVENVIDEIRWISNEYGIRQFEFIDNSFEDPFPYLERAKCIANALLEQDLKVAYGANMRAETCAKLTEQEIMLLKNSGFSYVYLGIEGFNSKSLRVYQKSATVEHNKKALSVLEENGIPVDIGFINFHPYVSFNDLRENVQNLQKYNLAYLQYILTFLFVFRGTSLYGRLKEDGLLYRDNGVEDFLCYHYDNSNVEEFANYLIGLKRRLESSGIMNEGYFIVHFRKKMAQLVNLMKKYEFYDTEMKKYVDSVKRFVDHRRKYINQVTTEWFINLLELFECGLDTAKADEITEVFLRYLEGDYYEKMKEMKTVLYARAYKKFIRFRIRIK